jgi:hypothetical protein
LFGGGKSGLAAKIEQRACSVNAFLEYGYNGIDQILLPSCVHSTKRTPNLFHDCNNCGISTMKGSGRRMIIYFNQANTYNG